MKTPREELQDQIASLTPEQRALMESWLRDKGIWAQASAEQRIPRAAERGTAPVSFAQQRLWVLDQLIPGNPSYNLSSAYRVRGLLDPEILRQSLAAVIARHETLRTTFPVVGEQPVQRVAASQAPELPVSDVSGLPDSRRKKKAEEWVAAESGRPFDLACGPLLRAALLRVTGREHVLLLTMHHIVSDGWSLGILIRELAQAYEALAAGRPVSLPELSIQYGDFARWQRESLHDGILEKQLAYWSRQLAELPVLDLPTDRPRLPTQSFRGARRSISLPRSLTRSLKELSQREGVTLYMTMLAAFQALLSRYTGQDDVVVGSPVAGRNRTEVEGLIGFFVNTLVLRTDLSGNPSFRELVQRVREVALGAYAHQDLPFERLVAQLQPERNLSLNPLFQVTLSLQNTPAAELDLAGLSWTGLNADTGTTRFDLEVYVGESGAQLEVTVIYSTDLFNAGTIESLSRHFQTLLEGVVADPDRRVGELPLLTEPERRRILVDWNDNRTQAPPTGFLHERFEVQAARAPEAVAVEFEGDALTYGQLNRRANRLARHLRKLGVGPDVLVGICLDRSLEMVIAVIAVLKAGGAYVPLDPAYPAERLAFMMEDAEIPVLLTEKPLEGALPVPPRVRVCFLDAEAIAREGENNLEPVGSTESTAYVIYTSGSTGKPKGVLVSHGNVDRLFTSTEPWFGFDARDVWTLFHSYAFDFSVWELWGALRYGGRLVVVPQWVTRSPEAFHELLARVGVTVLNQTPSAFRPLIDADLSSSDPLRLRLVVFGGEALDPEMLRPWFDRHGDEFPRLINMYGITETTVHVTYHPVTRADLLPPGASVIGRPIPDLQAYVLDRHLNPCPAGIPGELHVAGSGLAAGYLRRPDLTGERFIPNPFAGRPGERLYRTGDLARYFPDGRMEYRGRIDQQVKIRGHRIELGEVEAALRSHPAVQETVVMAREDAPGDKRLVAYVVPDERFAYTVRQLLRLDREGLLPDLPRYELPNGMVVVHRAKSETDFVYQEIFVDQSYLRHGVTLHDGDCVFDVGANIGLFTLFAGQRRRNLTIYAFEPIPPIFQLLSVNASLYDLDVRLFDCGLSDEDTTAPFTYYPHASVISGRFADAREERETVHAFLRNQLQAYPGGQAPSGERLDEMLQDRLTSERFTCRVRPISDVIRENGVERIDLLKIDVEKSERDVLAGIREEDWSKIRQIVVEVHDIAGRLESIENLLRSRGYDLTVEQDELLKKTGLYNIYAVRSSAAEGPRNGDANAPAPDLVTTWSSPNVLVGDLRRVLKQELPEYMVPSAFVLLEALPLTPSGKLNRRALPASSLLRPASERTYEAPRTAVEHRLAEIWGDLLRLERVGIHDNFFELGGDSILSIQIVARAREAGLRLSPRQLFESPTISELAPLAGAAPHVEAEQGAVIGEVPLTPIQRWFLELRLPAPHHFNLPTVLEIPQPVDPELLTRALSALMVHHDALRLRLRPQGSEWLQVSDAPAETPLMRREDLSALPPAEQDAAVERIATELQASLDLSDGPILRAALFDRGAARSARLLIAPHHLAVDSVSLRILREDLEAAYDRLRDGREVHLPPKTTSFQEWSRRLLEHARSEELMRELPYWLEESRRRAAPIAAELAHGPDGNTEGSARTVSIHLDEEETRLLVQRIPEIYQSRINDVLLAAVTLSLADWLDRDAFLIDVEGHGREELFEGVDLSRTVGWFTTLFPVLLTVPESRDAVEALQTTKARLRAIPERGIGYGLLRYASGNADVAARLRAMPAAQVSFNYLGQFDSARRGGSKFRLLGRSAGLPRDPSQKRAYVLDVGGRVLEGRLEMVCTYSERLHRRATIQRLANGFREKLRALIARCRAAEATRPADVVDVPLSGEDLQRVLAEITYPETPEN